MKKGRGKTIFISSFIVLLLVAGLGFLRFGHYKLVVVRGDAETEEHDEHEREQHARKSAEVHNEGKDKGESDEHDSEEIVKIDDLQKKKLNIKLGTAGPGKLSIVIDLPGEIVLDADHLAHIVPLLPGVVREVKKRLGQTVHQELHWHKRPLPVRNSSGKKGSMQSRNTSMPQTASQRRKSSIDPPYKSCSFLAFRKALSKISKSIRTKASPVM